VAGCLTHPDAEYVETLEEASQILLDRVQSGDVVITLGAGDGYLIGERVLEGLQARQSAG
jgi:UDP-N-acetylmuramate--alanine ligase